MGQFWKKTGQKLLLEQFFGQEGLTWASFERNWPNSAPKELNLASRTLHGSVLEENWPKNRRKINNFFSEAPSALLSAPRFKRVANEEKKKFFSSAPKGPLWQISDL